MGPRSKMAPWQVRGNVSTFSTASQSLGPQQGKRRRFSIRWSKSTTLRRNLQYSSGRSPWVPVPATNLLKDHISPNIRPPRHPSPLSPSQSDHNQARIKPKTQCLRTATPQAIRRCHGKFHRHLIQRFSLSLTHIRRARQCG